MTHEDVSRIEQRMNAIFGKLDELTVAVTTQSAVCGQCGPRVSALEVSMKGNGRKGVLTRLANVEVVLSLIGAILVLVLIPLSIGAGTIYANLRQAQAQIDANERVGK